MSRNFVVALAQRRDEGAERVIRRLLWIFVLALLCAYGAAAPAQSAPTRTVALTFDDLPLAVPGDDQAAGELAEVQRVNGAILSGLSAHHATAIGFVNEI